MTTKKEKQMTTKEFYEALLAEVENEELVKEIEKRLDKLAETSAKKTAKARAGQAEEEAVLLEIVSVSQMTGEEIVAVLAEQEIKWSKQKVAAVAKRLVDNGAIRKEPKIVDKRVLQFYGPAI